jgi:Uncharacterized protein conserved in bacteria
MTHYLIVNADDYGLTPGVSAGIRRAHLTGLVTSTTAMMNQPYVLQELPKLFAECPNLGLGVHLTLTLGAPVLPVAQVPSLVDENGHFFRRDPFIRHLEQLNLDEVVAEWHAQVEKFIHATGRQPDHLDAHHHSAYFTPALFSALLDLAAEYRCPIRVPYGLDSAGSAAYLPGENLEANFAKVSEMRQQRAPRTTEGFCGTFYDETATLPYLRHALKQISLTPQHTWELMVHPAEVDEPLLAISSYAAQRARELEVLTDSTMQSYVDSLLISKGSFAQI